MLGHENALSYSQHILMLTRRKIKTTKALKFILARLGCCCNGGPGTIMNNI